MSQNIHTNGIYPELTTGLAELIEKETETYYRSDPDPFDNRHPSVSKPDCSLGTLLKKVVRERGLHDHVSQ